MIFPAEEEESPLYFSCSVPKEIVRLFAGGGQFIFFLEAVAQCLPMWVWWPKLAGSYLSFVDNVAAQWALSKGYSKNSEANLLVSLFWAAVTEKGSDPWFERVPSKANISDAISRGDDSEAAKRGWVKWDVDLTKTWQVLMNAHAGGYQKVPSMASELCLSAKLQRCP